MSIRERNISDIQKELSDLVNELHLSAHRTIRPNYPLCLVFVLPKATMRGGLHLPDQQNKPVHEGIVLATHGRHEVTIRKKDGSLDTKVTVCPVKAGDHVIFQQHAGVPVPFLNLDRLHSALSSHGDFRLIRTDNSDLGSIMGVLETTKSSVEDKLKEHLSEESVRFLLEDFILISKDLKPQTTSGA